MDFTKELKSEYERLKHIQVSKTRKEREMQLHDASKKLFAFLLQLQRKTGKKLILLLENLQMLFDEQLTDNELKLLRSIMQEHPDGFIIIGTALTVMNQIEAYGKPFYHFFKLRRIEQLSKENMVHFMNNAASHYNNPGVYRKIKENRPFIYTFQLLAGGNPRLILLLYELIRDSSHLSTELILEKIMELTPYFKDRTLEVYPRNGLSSKPLLLAHRPRPRRRSPDILERMRVRLWNNSNA
jgi:hypothetical protein